jgi:soluble lytic murein transglycosylase-like protein
MKSLLNQFGQDNKKALAAYNWGQGNLRKVLVGNRPDWTATLPVETQQYIVTIGGYHAQYKNSQ